MVNMIIKENNINIAGLKSFKFMIAAIAGLLIFTCAATTKSDAAQGVYPDGLKLKIGFVSGSGLVLFYTGPDSGLTAGETYTAYSETGKLAVIRVEKIESKFTSAKIISGSIQPEYTGKYAMVFSNAPSPAGKKEKEPVAAEAAPRTDIESDELAENEKPQPASKTKKKPVEEVASSEEDNGFSQPPAESAPPQQATKSAAKKGPVYSLLVRYDSHSSGDYPDSNIATILSATHKGRNAFTTLYVLNNTDISNRIPDYFGFGLNYTQYMSPIWSYSLGYNYQARDDVDYIPDFKTRIDTVNAALYRTIVPKTMKNSVFNGWAAYSTRANFREGRSYSGNMSYIQKLKNNMRFSVSFRRLWLFGDEGFKHSSDQYGTDFSFMFKDKRITFGYYYLDREYFGGSSVQKDDRNFRLSVFSSGK